VRIIEFSCSQKADYVCDRILLLVFWMRNTSKLYLLMTRN
jgi:hypothetical protein